MKGKWLALLLAGAMCVAAVPGMAQGVQDFDAAQVAPLLNAVTSAAMGADGESVFLEEDETPPEGFLPRLSKALADQGIDVGAMGNLIAMAVSDQGTAADVAPLTLRVLTVNQSGDGDAAMLVGEAIGADGQTLNWRAVIELRREDASPVGWKLYRFVVGDTALEEELLGGYFTETMMEYLNADCGYIIQYPAIFTETMIVQTATGIQAALPNDSASFAVSRMENSEGLTLETLLQRELAKNPQGAQPQAWINEELGNVQSLETDGEGISHMAVYLVSERYIYQAELNYPENQAETYRQYADYMINSFSADELGHG